MPANRRKRARTQTTGGSKENRADPALRLNRTTVGEQVTAALRDGIVSGRYPEGAALRQDALASELGVSRIPVREALRQLEAEGLVELSAHYGAVVSSLSIPEIDELFELRALLEGELIQLSTPDIAPESIERAEAVLRAYENAFRTGDTEAWGALNWEFHAILLTAADRPLTFEIVRKLHNQSDRYMRMQLKLTGGQSRATIEHRSILKSVARGDAVKARRLLESHVRGAGRQLTRFLRGARSEATPLLVVGD